MAYVPNAPPLTSSCGGHAEDDALASKSCAQAYALSCCSCYETPCVSYITSAPCCCTGSKSSCLSFWFPKFDPSFFIHTYSDMARWALFAWRLLVLIAMTAFLVWAEVREVTDRIYGSYEYLFDEMRFGVDRSAPDFVPRNSRNVFLSNIWFKEDLSDTSLSLNDLMEIVGIDVAGDISSIQGDEEADVVELLRDARKVDAMEALFELSINASYSSTVMQAVLDQLRDRDLILWERSDGIVVGIDFKRMRETLHLSDLALFTRWAQLILVAYFLSALVAAWRPEEKVLYWQNFLCTVGFLASFMVVMLFWIAVYDPENLETPLDEFLSYWAHGFVLILTMIDMATFLPQFNLINFGWGVLWIVSVSVINMFLTLARGHPPYAVLTWDGPDTIVWVLAAFVLTFIGFVIGRAFQILLGKCIDKRGDANPRPVNNTIEFA